MLLLIDNYDSFTYNLVHYVGGLGVDVKVVRNDAITVDEAMGMGAGMGGGGHANNPTFMFQADWNKNKVKPAIFVISVMFLGTWVPWRCVCFAQKKVPPPPPERPSLFGCRTLLALHTPFAP